MLEQRIDVLSDRVLKKADAICFTSNGILTRDGRLVMGAGVAKAFKNKFILLDGAAGDTIKKNGNICQIIDYSGFDECVSRPPIPIVAFPTKHHWKDPSNIELIEKSAKELMELVEQNNWKLVALPRPGCNNGGLNWNKVKVVISPILDNRVVIVYL